MATASHSKPTAGFWFTAALVAVLVGVGYVLSAGPAAMMHDSLGRPWWTLRIVNTVYAPLVWAIENGPECIRDAFNAYVLWWAPVDR